MNYQYIESAKKLLYYFSPDIRLSLPEELKTTLFSNNVFEQRYLSEFYGLSYKKIGA